MLTSCAANSKVKYYMQFNSNRDILKRYNKIILYYLSSSRPGSAKKEQGEKSCVVSHNNKKQYLLFHFHRLVYIILQTVPDCNAYAQIDLLSPAREKQTERARQLQHTMQILPIRKLRPQNCLCVY